MCGSVSLTTFEPFHTVPSHLLQVTNLFQGYLLGPSFLQKQPGNMCISLYPGNHLLILFSAALSRCTILYSSKLPGMDIYACSINNVAITNFEKMRIFRSSIAVSFYQILPHYTVFYPQKMHQLVFPPAMHKNLFLYILTNTVAKIKAS